jgi:hypothetical protein
MSRCPEPKSDADVRSLLRGDDLNPAQCLASAGCAGRVRLASLTGHFYFHLFAL